jgi:hypothetical protein
MEIWRPCKGPSGVESESRYLAREIATSGRSSVMQFVYYLLLFFAFEGVKRGSEITDFCARAARRRNARVTASHMKTFSRMAWMSSTGSYMLF